MEVVESLTTDIKSKKKPKKKKSSKLNNNHCGLEEKSTENGVTDTNLDVNLSEKIDELYINNQKNGLKPLVNGLNHVSPNHFEENIQSEKSECNNEVDAGSRNNNNKKVGSKKKKSKKQKEPDKVVEAPSNETPKLESSLASAESTNSKESTKIVDEEQALLEKPKIVINYKEYESELQMPDIMQLIQKDLSEPYSIYTYRYFIHNWPKLCFLAMHENKCVGAIVCKLDMHKMVRRGYIAMLAVDKDYRKLKIGTTLVQKAIEAMLRDTADEVVLETEITNRPALKLYENLGFVRDKRLFHYYLNGVDALRLKLWFR